MPACWLPVCKHCTLSLLLSGMQMKKGIDKEFKQK